jgi:Cu/Ag efflux protein CusF
MKHFTKFIPVAALLCLGHVHAADMNMQNMDMKDMQGMHMQHKNGPAKAVGIVKQIDRGNEVVTIHHEPIKSLGWSSMTMDLWPGTKRF